MKRKTFLSLLVCGFSATIINSNAQVYEYFYSFGPDGLVVNESAVNPLPDSSPWIFSIDLPRVDEIVSIEVTFEAPVSARDFEFSLRSPLNELGNDFDDWSFEGIGDASDTLGDGSYEIWSKNNPDHPGQPDALPWLNNAPDNPYSTATEEIFGGAFQVSGWEQPTTTNNGLPSTDPGDTETFYAAGQWDIHLTNGDQFSNTTNEWTIRDYTITYKGVPEPSSGLLAIAGACALILRRRRR